ncbi:MAG TPA: nucleotidyltransferase domain-containing protein [Armatimonadota bacterium]
MAEIAMVNTRIPLPMDRIRDICRKYDVTELSVFGSVLRDDFRPDSDVDFLVVFRNDDAGPWAGKFMYMEEELSTLLGRPVDVVDKSAVEASGNYIRRAHILKSAEVIFAPA